MYKVINISDTSACYNESCYKSSHHKEKNSFYFSFYFVSI